MLEAVAVPALLKAVDWLFGESSKILQERRERRKAAGMTESAASEAQQPLPSSEAIRAREDALHHPIQETLWRNSEAHVRHLLSLLEIYTKNYHLAREQHAKWGSALAPPIIMHSLSEAEDKILEVTKDLQAVLSTIYGKKVSNPETEMP